MNIPLRVLLIEDSEDDAVLLLRELRRGGYEPMFEQVDTAVAMSAALEQQTWDVVINDYSVPQFNAPAALTLLQEKELDLPFIMVSGSIGENTAVAAMKAGAHDFILKGNLARLVPALSRELREAAERRSRKRAEEALRQSEERFRLLVEGVRDYAIFTLAPDGHIASWNAGAERIFGFKEAESVGQHFSCIFTPEDIYNCCPDQELQTAASTGAALDERWHVRRDGIRFWASGVLTALRDEAGFLRGFAKVVRDITNRKQAEEALKESQERLELAQQAGNIGTFEWNIQTSEVTWTQELEALYGLAPGSFGGKYNNWVQALHPDDRSRVEKEIMKAAREGTELNTEFRILWPDESLHWIVAKAQVLNDNTGKPSRMIGVNLDITERKQAEQVLRQRAERERLVAKLAQHNPRSSKLVEVLNTIVTETRQFLCVDRVFIYHFEPDWSMIVTVESVDSHWPTALGARLKDPSFVENYVPLYRKGRVQVTPNIYTAGLTQCHIDFLTRFQVIANLVVPIVQGEKLWGLLVAQQCSGPRQWQPLEIDLFKQLATQVAIAIQQEEFYQAEEALRESEERFRATFNSAAVGIAHVAVDGKWLLVNQKLCDIVGYRQEELLERTFQDITHPNDLNADLGYIRKILANELQTYSMEKRYIRKDASLVWINLTVSLVRELSGEPKYFIAVIEDIRERKQAAEQIKASLHEKEVLLKEIHHRVKNNMQVICSLLNLQSASIKDPQTLELLQEGQNRIALMALIHEQLYQSEDLARIDFADYIQLLTANLFNSYDVHAEAIALKINVHNVFLSVDAAIPCGLIINELVANSLKYAFPLGKPGEIRVEFHSDKHNYLTLSVSDNGIGLPPELDFKNTESLGLQLVTALTSQLSGTIELERNMGTKFKITFFDNNKA